MLQLYILIVLFLPLLPTIMGRSHIHVHVVILALSFFVLLKAFRRPLYLSVGQFSILIIYVLMQCSLLLTGVFSPATSANQIFSLLQPSILALSFLGLAVLLNETNKPSEGIAKAFALFAVVSLFWSVLEYLNLSEFNRINYFLYKRDEKDDVYRYATTFFGVSYYSGYAFFTIFCVLVDRFVKENSYKLFYGVGAVCSALCVIAAQSKVQILSLFIVLNVLLLIRRPTLFFVLIVFSVAPLFFFSEQILIFLKSLLVVVVKSLATIIADPSSSETLAARLDQISLATEDMMFLGALGAGSGSGVYLESWVAEFLYRYGLPGILYFFLFVFCSITFFRNKTAGITLWLLLLPLTQLSTASFLLSKNFFISSLVLAYALKEKQSNSSNTSI